jgi:6-phosphogluconolactonase
VANYFGNRLVFFTLENGNWVRNEAEPYSGSGPDPDRQQGPRLHQVVHLPGPGCLAVADLGSDRIWLHRMEAGRPAIAPFFELALPPGSGPRHMVFHTESQCLYILCELSGLIELFRWNGKTWNHQADAGRGMRPLPDASAIRLRPGRNVICAASRKESRIALFSVMPDGSLREDLRIPTGGLIPRDFAIFPDGHHLLAACQESNSLSLIPISDSSPLCVHPEISCGSPVCISLDS